MPPSLALLLSQWTMLQEARLGAVGRFRRGGKGEKFEAKVKREAYETEIRGRVAAPLTSQHRQNTRNRLRHTMYALAHYGPLRTVTKRNTTRCLWTIGAGNDTFSRPRCKRTIVNGHPRKENVSSGCGQPYQELGHTNNNLDRMTTREDRHSPT